jgi:hypothetical protein
MRIEDYAMVGDPQSAAIVGKDGSVGWLCVPRFDSPSCFAALVGAPEQAFSHLALIEAAKAISSGGEPTRTDSPAHVALADGS